MEFAIDATSLKRFRPLRHGSASQVSYMSAAISNDNFGTGGILAITEDEVGYDRIVTVDQYFGASG